MPAVPATYDPLPEHGGETLQIGRLIRLSSCDPFKWPRIMVTHAMFTSINLLFHCFYPIISHSIPSYPHLEPLSLVQDRTSTPQPKKIRCSHGFHDPSWEQEPRKFNALVQCQPIGEHPDCCSGVPISPVIYHTWW